MMIKDLQQSVSKKDDQRVTRGPRHKLESQFSKLYSRKNFFTNRNVNEWNKLDNKAVDVTTVNGFKNRLDSYCKLKKCWCTGLS